MYNDIFLGYARHMQELDDIAEYIIQMYNAGRTDDLVSCIDNLTPSDIKYIEKRLKKYGFSVTITVN